MSPGKIMNISHEADILSLPEFTQDSSEEGHVYRKDSGKEALGEYLIFGNLKNSSYEENSLDRLIEFIDFREDIPLSNSQITLNNEFENSNNFNFKDYNNINDNDPTSFFNNVTENSFSSTDFHDAFSVLGVDLDFCYNDMTESNTLLNQDLDKLINDTVIDLEMKDFGYDLFENDAFTVLDDNIYEEENDAENLNLNLNSSRNLQILNMFPHIKDERNRRRRSLLYESRYKTTDPLRNKLKTNNTQNKIEFEKTNTHNINQNFNQVNKTDDKYFSCPIASCDKCYAKLSHLKAHLRRHSGEKPFACNWINCSWKFSRSDELARHKRSHSGIKPYKCELCEKAFARSDHLAKHKKVHKKKMTLYGTNHIKNRSKYNGIKSL